MGEKLFEDPEPTLTGFEESKSSEEWECVERILPKGLVPSLPEHASYPTPSGWVPPKGMILVVSFFHTAMIAKSEYPLHYLKKNSKYSTCMDNVCMIENIVYQLRDVQFQYVN